MGCFSPPQESKSKSSGAAKTPEQTAALKQMLDAYTGSIGTGENIFQGPMVAGPTQTQQDIFNMAGQFLPSIGPFDPSNIPIFGQAQDAIQKLLSGGLGAQPITPEQTSDFFNRAIADPARFTFEDVTRPLIREEFAGPGFSGSARANRVVESGQDLERQLGEQRAGLEFDVLKQNQAIEQQQAQNALASLPAAFQLATLPENIRTQRLSDLNNILLTATQQQLNEQALIDEEIERFAMENRITGQEDLGILLTLLDLNFSTSASSARGAQGPGLGLSLLSSMGGK